MGSNPVVVDLQSTSNLGRSQLLKMRGGKVKGRGAQESDRWLDGDSNMAALHRPLHKVLHL